MPEKGSGLGRRTLIILVSFVLIISSVVFLLLSACGLWFIAVAAHEGGPPSIWVTGLASVLVSVPALYLIQRAWRRLSFKDPKPE